MRPQKKNFVDFSKPNIYLLPFILLVISHSSPLHDIYYLVFHLLVCIQNICIYKTEISKECPIPQNLTKRKKFSKLFSTDNCNVNICNTMIIFSTSHESCVGPSIHNVNFMILLISRFNATR